MSRNLLVWVLVAGLAGLSAIVTGCGDTTFDVEQTFVRPSGPGSWVLVDGIHTIKQNPRDFRLVRNDYAYQGMHGYARLFDHLEAHDYPWSMIRYTSANERITPDVLEGFSVLFINLVSEDRPDFAADEIDAIDAFVRAGGGLFVIVDHTNVYRSSEMTNPLLEPMGTSVPYETAMDKPGEFGIDGGAWLKIRNFADHPVTEGVSVASFETGTPLLTDYGVAFTSPDGFGDVRLSDSADGMGNWHQDPGETTGSLPLVSARELGEGRVVVAGDQNVFGDEWLYAANNFELVTNIFEWVAGNEDAEVPLREARSEGFFRVGLDLEHSSWSIGSNRCEAFFPFYINFNRTENVIARGTLSVEDGFDALVFVDPDTVFADSDIAAVHRHLQQGKTVVIVTDVTRAGAGTRHLLTELLPDLRMLGTHEFGVGELPSAPGVVETFVGSDEFEVSSSALDAAGLRVAGHSYGTGLKCPVDVAEADPYARKVTALSGEVFVTMQVDGETVDVARSFEVDGGRVIVFFQDGFWRNETLGTERQVPTEATVDAHVLEYKFIDWLVNNG